MGLDAICMTALAVELNQLVGCKVDKIHQPGRDDVIFLLRGMNGSQRLLLSASPNHPRAQMTELTRENPDKPPMFCMLLRKHLVGGRLLSITQPPRERILKFIFETNDELGDKTTRTLVLEAMGRRANLILLDSQERIVDCVRRVDAEMSPDRQVLPGMFYRLPEFHGGVPPLLRRELEFRGTDEVENGLEKMEESVKMNNFTPTMLVRDGRPVDFSFLPILQYGPQTENHPFDSFGALLDAFYETRERQERIRQKGQDFIKTVTNARDRTLRKLGIQGQELLQTQNRERLRELGDIITSNLHIMYKGMAVLRALDFYDENGGEVDIPLDPLRTPQQNAAKYYKDYNRAKVAESVLTLQMEKGEKELDYLNSVLESISEAEGERDLQEIRQELVATGYMRAPSKSKGKEKKVVGRPMEFRSTSGLAISVGKNNSQNDQLTLKSAHKSDWWFHTQKIHGSHVILWTEGREPDSESVTQAAMLAAWFSQGREGQKVAVDFTPVKFVKKPSGARPGRVIYTTYETAYVTPNEGLVKELRIK